MKITRVNGYHYPLSDGKENSLWAGKKSFSSHTEKFFLGGVKNPHQKGVGSRE